MNTTMTKKPLTDEDYRLDDVDGVGDGGGDKAGEGAAGQVRRQAVAPPAGPQDPGLDLVVGPALASGDHGCAGHA